jgi:hypothetical protein
MVICGIFFVERMPLKDSKEMKYQLRVSKIFSPYKDIGDTELGHVNMDDFK